MVYTEAESIGDFCGFLLWDIACAVVIVIFLSFTIWFARERYKYNKALLTMQKNPNIPVLDMHRDPESQEALYAMNEDYPLDIVDQVASENGHLESMRVISHGLPPQAVAVQDLNQVTSLNNPEYVSQLISSSAQNVPSAPSAPMQRVLIEQ